MGDDDLIDPEDAATDAEFRDEALSYAPAGEGAPADTVTPSSASASTVPPPAHGQLVQTTRTTLPAPGELAAIDQVAAAQGDVGAAQGELGAARSEAAQGRADAADQDATRALADAQEVADKQAQAEERAAKARELADEAEKQVKDFKFHDYGSDRSLGDRVLSKIAVAFGSFNLGGHHPHNEAAEALIKAADRDFDKQKLELLSKENIARWRRAGVTDAVSQMHQEIGALQIKQAKFHEAAAAKALASAIRSGMPVAEAESNVLVKQNMAKAAADRAKAMKSFETVVTAQYGTSAKAKGGRGKGESELEKEINKRMDKYETQATGTSRAPGPVRVLSQIEAMRNGLDEAIRSNDTDRLKAAVVKAKEQAGTLMSGGKLTEGQIAILHTLESSSDDVMTKLGKWTGSPTEGAGLVRRLTSLIDDAGSEISKQIADIRQRGIDEHLGPGGLANTPEAKRKFENRNRGIYSQAKWHGKPLFDEGGARASVQTKTVNGKTYYKVPGGWDDEAPR